MAELMDIFGALLLAAGSFFLFLGSLGLMRMPDVFNRIQAGTKSTTLGTLLVLLGTTFIHPGWGLKLLLIGVFLLFTNPLSSQVLANAAHRSKTRQSDLVTIDHLAEDRSKKE
jgi:multicomponent Na+:H+ antiporter subunit G